MSGILVLCQATAISTLQKACWTSVSSARETIKQVRHLTVGNTSVEQAKTENRLVRIFVRVITETND